MLKEYRLIYETKADAYLSDIDWRHMNKNHIFNKYCEYENINPKLAEAYLSALIVRYWHLIKTYYNQGSGAYTAEDCYYWLVHVISWATKHKPGQKGGSMENDPNGPDKYINVSMKSRREGFYQWSNAAKRSAYFTQSTSLEKMIEDTGDANLPYFDNVNDMIEFMDIKDLVVSQFKNKLYMGAFIIDGILNAPVIDTITDKNSGSVYTEFNKKKLSKHIRNMDDNYCKLFSKMYNIPESDVIQARDECCDLSATRIYNYMKNTLLKLKKNIVED